MPEVLAHHSDHCPLDFYKTLWPSYGDLSGSTCLTHPCDPEEKKVVGNSRIKNDSKKVIEGNGYLTVMVI